MIIVKTSNGDLFINDKKTLFVQHDREHETVTIKCPQEGLNCIISNVEGILYTNDAQPTSWQDEGSEIQRLHKILKEKSETIDRLTLQKKAIENDLHHFAFEMEQVACHYSGKIPAEVVRQIQTPALAMKSKVLNKSYDQQQ